MTARLWCKDLRSLCRK